MKKLLRLIRILFEWFKSPLFGFVEGHSYLVPHDLDEIQKLVGTSGREKIADFERRFAALVGEGHAVAFAAGRMGFYALMKTLGIGPGDEVVIPGATCAVMANAVLRTGATPIFADIDPETFGSAAQHIERCLTSRTRMIVAQHSFGIPCDIKPITALAQRKKIFLLEDCALTLGSTLDGVAVGNFGGAALFSTDHTKPLNTLIGGLVYTRDANLAGELLEVQAAAPELPITKQEALWSRLLLERRYCHPSRYGHMGVIDVIDTIRSMLFRRAGPFLLEDGGATPSTSYPYPARLPSFLAALGLCEVERWPRVAAARKELLNDLLDVTRNTWLWSYIPKAYLNKRLEVIPLRFAWSQPDGASVRERLSCFVHVAWTWFLQPIVATPDPLESLGYQKTACPVSERIGPGMVNLPCNLGQHDAKQLVALFRANLLRITR